MHRKSDIHARSHKLHIRDFPRLVQSSQQQQQGTLSGTGKPVAEQHQGTHTSTGKPVAEENSLKVDLRIQGIPQDAVLED